MMWLGLLAVGVMMMMDVCPQVQAQTDDDQGLQEWRNGMVWSTMTSSTPTSLRPAGRIDGAFVYDALRSRVLLFGGRGANGTVLSDTWELQLEIENEDTTSPTLASSVAWSRISTPIERTPGPRFDFVSGVLTIDDDTYFVIATGDAGAGVRLNDVWALRLSRNNASSNANEGWLQVTIEKDASNDVLMPRKRYGAVGGAINGTNQLLVTHGFDAARFHDSFKLTLTLDEDATTNGINGKWEEISRGSNEYSPSSPHARCLGAGSVSNRGDLVMFGGCLTGGKTGGPCPSNDGWVLTSSTSTSTSASSGSGSGNENPNGNQKEVEYSWNRAENGPAASWKNIMTTWESSGEVLLYGGSDTSNQVLTTSGTSNDELNLLNPKTGTWRRFLARTETSIPSKREDMMMTSLVVGNAQHSIMWGGRASGNQFDSEVYLLSASLTNDNNENVSSGEVSSGGKRWFTIWMLHGIFMFLGWGVCLQGGAFVARYFRDRDPWWFKFHRMVQSIGLLLALVGFALGIMSANTVAATHFQFTHAILGLVIMIIGCLQPLNAFIRPHPGEKWRELWSFFHKNLGRLALILALVNIALGFFMALATKAIYVTYFVYIGVLLAAYIVFEARLRAQRKPKDAAAAAAGTSTEAAIDISQECQNLNLEEASHPDATDDIPFEMAHEPLEKKNE